MKERIFETCNSFLSKRIGPDDLLLRASNGFAVLPAPGRGESVADFTARLDREMKEFFLGSDYLKELDLFASTVSFSLENLMAASQGSVIEEAAEANHDRPPPPVIEEERSRPAFEVFYKPVWSAKSSYIAMSSAVPTIRRRNEPDKTYHQILPGDYRNAELVDFDIRVLQHVAGHCARMAASSSICMVGIPVHFSTLTSPRLRIPFMTELRKLSDQQRKRISLRILHAPHDAPAGKYLEAVYTAQSHCPRVFVDIDFECGRLERFDAGKVDGFVIACPGDLNRFYRRWDALLRFTKAAGRLNAMVGMADCASEEIVREAIKSGVGLIAGPILPPPKQVPWTPSRYDLYSKRFLSLDRD